ncbi:MAG: class I SAM-dependent methyltransferase [Octadecabacter sp.]
MTDDGYFDAVIAAHYDDDPASTDPALIAATVDVLKGLARDGAALELAIGTGRIALPLAHAGVPVTGIEMSRAMVDRMREKPGGDKVPVAIGDMTTTQVTGEFALCFLIFNTINNLTTQDAQITCFANAAAHLQPGGAFVVEVGVPKLQLLPLGERFVPSDVSDTHWCVDEYDVVSQEFSSHHMHIREGAAQLNSVPFRYVWPSELDLMARMAGMRLTQRWADWTRAPFTALSPSHVSVWVKDA